MSETPRYHLTTMGAGDTFAANGYKYTGADRRLMEVLLYLGAEGHHHTGEVPDTDAPIAPVVSLDGADGNVPGGTRVYYKVTLVDPNGLESAASPESYVDTPAALTPPSAPSLLAQSTGGTLQPGTRYYSLSAYYPLQTQETTAPNPAPVQIFSGSTNSVKVTRPTLPVGATGWNVYRRNPGELDYFFVTSLVAATTFWIDDGATASACDRRRPQTNQTNATNSVLVSLGGATPSLPGAGWTWRIYRTYVNASYVTSFLHHVVEETSEGSGETALSHTDTGGATMVGQPPEATPVVNSPSKVLLTDGAEVEGTLPVANIAGFPFVVTFPFSGTVTAQNGTRVWVCEFPSATILGVRCVLGRNSGPASQPVIGDVKKWSGNFATPVWASIFTSSPALPRVLVGTEFGARVAPQIPDLVFGDAIVADILQAGGGATPTDTDLAIQVYMIGTT